MRFLAAGFCVPVVPESGILVGMYEIHEEVLCPEGIYPHGDTGYPVCNSCKEYAGGPGPLTQVQNGYAASISRAVS